MRVRQVQAEAELAEVQAVSEPRSTDTHMRAPRSTDTHMRAPLTKPGLPSRCNTAHQAREAEPPPLPPLPTEADLDQWEEKTAAAKAAEAEAAAKSASRQHRRCSHHRMQPHIHGTAASCSMSDTGIGGCCTATYST
eukprot:COSAG01_NODE_2158_length_8251_cov_8.554645_10_plen_137_part_00